jgi:hypothetical protein
MHVGVAQIINEKRGGFKAIFRGKSKRHFLDSFILGNLKIKFWSPNWVYLRQQTP